MTPLLRRTSCFILFSALIAGCASKGGVSGKVTFKSGPMPGGQVVFEGPDGKSPPSATIDPKDGSFSVATMPAGTYKVAVVPAGAPPRLGGDGPGMMPGVVGGPPGKTPPGVGTPPGAAPNAGAKWVDVPEEFRELAKTKLTVTITAGPPTPLNITIP